MAVLYIAEFVNVALAVQGQPPELAPMPPTVEQTLAIGAASVSCTAFASTTRVVRVHTDVVCAIAVGTAPTAVTASGTSASAAGSMRMVAGQTEYFSILPGLSHKIAVIATT